MISPLCSHHPQPSPQRTSSCLGWAVSKSTPSLSHRAAVQLSWHSWAVWQGTPPINVLTDRIKEWNLGKEAPHQAGTVAAWQGAFFPLIPYFKFAPNEPAPNTAQRPETSESLTAHFRLGKQARVLKFGSPCSGSGFQGNQWLQEPCKTLVLCSCSEHDALELPLTQTLPGRGFSSFSKAPGCNSKRSARQDTQNIPEWLQTYTKPLSVDAERRRLLLSWFRLQYGNKYFCFFLFSLPFKTKTTYTKRECQTLLRLHVLSRNGKAADEEHLQKYLHFILMHIQGFEPREKPKAKTSSTGSKDCHWWQWVVFNPPPAQLSWTPSLRKMFVVSNSYHPTASSSSRITTETDR